MIASIEGVVAEVGADALLIEAGGLGYRVYAGAGTLAGARVGGRLKLRTYHLVREDAQALYGFRTPEELGFFEQLLAVTGVGPKVALAIVSARRVPDLQLAILQSDDAVLTSVSGVGKKLAGRVILELKEKVAAAGMAAAAATGSGRGGERAGVSEGEVIAALQALGYTPTEARDAARAAAGRASPDASLEDRVKTALRGLARG
ncbi:MAG TPA: Holliday junction branch migration protein RuvA [Candidatus Limnocylindrales bacterium]|nr:Holliday junction branch migration protein RuvA [Candidatus Limnocylindrales bacterium]